MILDVVNNETAKMYKNFLEGYKPRIILLMPTYEEMMRRNKSRPPRIKQNKIDWVYNQQKKLTIFDDEIDNTKLEADRVAEILSSKWPDDS